MSTDLKRVVVEKLQTLTEEQQREVLAFMDGLGRTATPLERLGELIDDCFKDVPQEVMDQLLIGEDGAPFFDKTKSIAYIIRGKSWVNNHVHVLRVTSNLTSNLYLKYFLDQFDFHEYVNGTTRLKLTQGSMNEIPVKLPPLNEQRRIVAKLEKLLSRVDAAQARLATIPRILKRFRQSVLAAAYSGKLTADWRLDG